MILEGVKFWNFWSAASSSFPFIKKKGIWLEIWKSIIIILLPQLLDVGSRAKNGVELEEFVDMYVQIGS